MATQLLNVYTCIQFTDSKFYWSNCTIQSQTACAVYMTLLTKHTVGNWDLSLATSGFVLHVELFSWQYIYLATCTLQFLSKHLLSSSIPEMTEYVSHSFTETHIIGLVGVVKDLDQLAVISMPSYVDMDKLCSAVDQAVHLLLVSDLLTQHQQASWDKGQDFLRCTCYVFQVWWVT